MTAPVITVTPWQAAQAYAGVDRGAPAGTPSGTPAGAPGTDAGSGFGATLARAIGGVVGSSQDAEARATQAIAGQGSLTEVVTAVSKAELALQTTVAVRDRVVQAYQDIMRMPI